jgi:hypothetical protein
MCVFLFRSSLYAYRVCNNFYVYVYLNSIFLNFKNLTGSIVAARAQGTFRFADTISPLTASTYCYSDFFLREYCCSDELRVLSHACPRRAA